MSWMQQLHPFESVVVDAYSEIGKAIDAMTNEEREALWDAAQRAGREPNPGWVRSISAGLVRGWMPADREAIKRRRPEREETPA